MSELSLWNTLAFRSDYDCRTVLDSNFKQYLLLALYEDLQILYSHDKRKLSNGQSWKIWKETALIELWSYFIDILAFELGKLCPGVGILFRFFDPGAGVLH